MIEGVANTVTLAVLFAVIEAHPIECMVIVVEPVLVNEAAGISKVAVFVVVPEKVAVAESMEDVLVPVRL